jgi:hypothetical protein
MRSARDGKAKTSTLLVLLSFPSLSFVYFQKIWLHSIKLGGGGGKQGGKKGQESAPAFFYIFPRFPVLQQCSSHLEENSSLPRVAIHCYIYVHR